MAIHGLDDGFIRLCVSTDANYLAEGCRVLVEGQMLTEKSAIPDKIIRVRGTKELDVLFGNGSVLAETLKTVFCTCPSRISVFALPRKDVEKAVAAVYTLQITGVCMEDKRMDFFIGDGRYNFSLHLKPEDTHQFISGLIQDKLDRSLPFAITSIESTEFASTITFTAKNAGSVGNNLSFIYDWTGADKNTGLTFTWEQKTVGTGGPEPDDYASVIGACCYSCYILSSDNEQWQRNLQKHIRNAWDCAKPQCFGHGYVYNIGKDAKAVANTGTNAAELSRMAIHKQDPILPYLKNAAYGALSCCLGCENPEINIQGEANGLLACVSMPTTCHALWSWSDIEYLMKSGFVVTGPVAIGNGGLTNPYIFNDVTNYLYDDLYRENTTYRDVSSRRLAAATAVSLAQAMQKFNGLSFYTVNTNIREGTFGTNKRLILGYLRAWKKENDGKLFSASTNLEEDLVLETDFEKMPPCMGRPGVLHFTFKYRPPARLNRINVGLQPYMLENCDR